MSKKADDQPVIKQVHPGEGFERSTTVIREAFRTVAREFGLTRENNPTHPSFMTASRLRELASGGTLLYGIFQNDLQVGFVAIDPSQKTRYGLRNLAVLPDYRHHGYGRLLIAFALDYARTQKAHKVELSLMNDNSRLKQWYQELGFKEIALRNYPHLPFTVSFMEYDLDQSQVNIRSKSQSS